eukprot:1142832-Pelagomonas_calceolata.AAC.8
MTEAFSQRRAGCANFSASLASLPPLALRVKFRGLLRFPAKFLASTAYLPCCALAGTEPWAR